jgi:hypothetical protein
MDPRRMQSHLRDKLQNERPTFPAQHFRSGPIHVDCSANLDATPHERQRMKKIDVEKDYKRSKFLIVAMVVQVIVVLVVMLIYFAWLRA